LFLWDSLKTGDAFLENVVNGAVLICPMCGGRLSFSWVFRRLGDVQRAGIQCSSCAGKFEVVAQIPLLLPPGQFADWTHPFVEMLFGNIRMSVEEVIAEHGVEKVKDLYAKLIKGEYQRPQLVFDRSLDGKIIASGGGRLSKRAVEKHFKRIRSQTEGEKWVTEMVRYATETAPKRMVDACSGGGFFLACLLERFKKFEEFFSFDIDFHCAARVEGILRHYEIKEKTLSMVADARRQPFRSDFFDVVTNNYGFSQILGYSKALRETFRTLRPGGRLIMRQGFGITKCDRTEELASFLGLTVDELMMIHRFGDFYVDKESFLKCVENQGFSIDNVQDFDDCFLAVCGKPK